MKNAVWEKALKTCADPQRAKHFYGLLAATAAGSALMKDSAEHARLLCALRTPLSPDPHGRWQPTVGCVLGMGKLGGEELNYSSDVDVLFAYSEEGSVFAEPPGKTKSPRPVLANHQFFNRLAEMFIAE